MHARSVTSSKTDCLIRIFEKITRTSSCGGAEAVGRSVFRTVPNRPSRKYLPLFRNDKTFVHSSDTRSSLLFRGFIARRSAAPGKIGTRGSVTDRGVVFGKKTPNVLRVVRTECFQLFYFMFFSTCISFRLPTICSPTIAMARTIKLYSVRRSETDERRERRENTTCNIVIVAYRREDYKSVPYWHTLSTSALDEGLVGSILSGACRDRGGTGLPYERRTIRNSEIDAKSPGGPPESGPS